VSYEPTEGDPAAKDRLAPQESGVGEADPAAAGRLRDELTARLLDHDKHGAVAVGLGAVSRGLVTIEELYADVLGPALIEIGRRWHGGTVAVWEEHLASAAVRTIVESLYPEVERLRAERPAAGYSALMACPPDEAHDLGLRMLADRLALAGWRVFYLGPDTPFQEVVDATWTLGVDAVVLSSSTHYHRLRVRDFVERLVAALPGVAVWVGGPGFVGDIQGWAKAYLFDEEAVFGGSPPFPDRGDESAAVHERESATASGTEGGPAERGHGTSSEKDGERHSEQQPGSGERPDTELWGWEESGPAEGGKDRS